jgi:hypothetical protein
MSMRYAAGFISAFYNPLKVPNAPTIGTATAGVASASVTFTAPSDVGGGAITDYAVQAIKTSDGSTTVTMGASSPISVTGLSTTAYTFKVFATNAYGLSPLSAASNSATPTLPVIGSAFGGGFFAGQISTAGNSVADYNIVVGPVATAQTYLKWKNANTATPGSDSVIDGPQNTADMVADGNATVYPCAHFCNDLVIGGFSDWYMPAKNELEVCYYNLKPTTESNSTTSGINPNAVPARASNYTAGTPAQTSATNFQSTGTENYTVDFYWTSTEFSATAAWMQYFGNGYQSGRQKSPSFTYIVRAIRRVAV